MIHKKSVSLIIPCRNEEESLHQLLGNIPSFIDEVIVVDNGSTDNTPLVAQKHGAKLLNEKRTDRFGIGYGFAHQKGLQKATGDYIVTMDGDGTYPLTAIKHVILFMEQEELDFVSCSRFPLTKSHAISLMRKIGIFILNTEVQWLFGYKLHDILSGMWVMNKKTRANVKPHSGGWDFSPEVKLIALTSPKVAFSEYHIDHHYRSSGASKQQLWQTGFNHFVFIAKHRVRMLRQSLFTLLIQVSPTYR